MRESIRRRPFRLDDDKLEQARDGSMLLRASTENLLESILGVRALQAFDVRPGVFPLRRELRFAAKRAVDPLLDELAMEVATQGHRIDGDSLLMEGDEYVALATARRKTDYVSCTVQIWARGLAALQSVESRILAVAGDDLVREQLFTIDWHFQTSYGLSSVSFEEVADPQPTDAAYPTITEGVECFIASFLDANETVLLLQGPPGTGKTRLVRAILAAVSRRKGSAAKAMYTADRRTLENDELFVDFLTGEHDAFVVEDADHLLGSRANGNVDLHRFLTVADGVVRAKGRKIIFSTNLHNVGDIDEALIRPGRCFRVVRTRALTMEEAKLFVTLLDMRTDTEREQVLRMAFGAEGRGATIAELYRHIVSATASACTSMIAQAN